MVFHLFCIIMHVLPTLMKYCIHPGGGQIWVKSLVNTWQDLVQSVQHSSELL